MELDRQPIPDRPDRRRPPQRLPETRPPVLGDWFIYLSVIVLICGAVAITALNFGSDPRDAVVRFPALVAAGLLVPISLDAAARSWRSAWAWLPVDRARGLSRFVWTAVLSAIGTASAAVAIVLLLL